MYGYPRRAGYRNEWGSEFNQMIDVFNSSFHDDDKIYYTIEHPYTEKTIFPFPFTLNGIWSWWQFLFDFEPNGIQFGTKSKGRLSPQPYLIRFQRKWKYSFLSARMLDCTLTNILGLMCKNYCLAFDIICLLRVSEVNEAPISSHI